MGLPSELFFDTYENDNTVAGNVDKLCMSCPIQRECLSLGVARREWGVWGGIYLQDGEISDEFNEHKDNKDWSELWLNLTTQMK